jgi:hypothetical protein
MKRKYETVLIPGLEAGWELRGDEVQAGGI